MNQMTERKQGKVRNDRYLRRECSTMKGRKEDKIEEHDSHTVMIITVIPSDKINFTLTVAKHGDL